VEEATVPGSGASRPVVREPRQRWRIVFRRAATASQRELVPAWEQAVVESGLPVLMSPGERPRPRLVFAAALPVSAAAEAELADLTLIERRPVWDVRERLERVLPPGNELVSLFDVWLGEPALPGLVIAAEWRITLREETPVEPLRAAVGELLAATSLPRDRQRAGTSTVYDLRPLLGHLSVGATSPPTLHVRTLYHAERGVGRPDEVIAALSERAGRPLTIASLVRERLELADRRSGAHAAQRRSPTARGSVGARRPEA
jgi:radical SAM-linked protein